MKTISTTFFSLFFTFHAIFSQVSILVLNKETDAPISHVLIQSIQHNWSDVSNNKGTITIPDKFKTDSFWVNSLGYLSQKISVPRKSKVLVLTLDRDPTLIEEVNISAISNGTKRDFKGSSFVVGSKSLSLSQPIGTEEVLKTIPGVNILGDIGISNRPNISIRGSWGRRSKKVLLLEDGSPIAPAPYIAPGTYYNPASDRLQAIEVMKGADILKYGPNNMYGAINYITAMPPNHPEARLKITGGQRNYLTLLGSYGGTWNNLGALFEGVYKSFGGFQENSSVKILNLNAKIFAKIDKNQSLYFKVSGQFEDNQASLSGITPFTFQVSPQSNPFDADHFSMRRYGLDIIHKWTINKNSHLISKAYASDFQRDWWKQTTQKIRAIDAWSYLDSSTINNKYSYLNNKTLNDEDWILVGKRINGIESAMDSRWEYTVAGLKENWSSKWSSSEFMSHEVNAGINYHYESFKDITLMADSSKWARDGRVVSDYWYELYSLNGFGQYVFNYKKISIAPIVRFEDVSMYKQNLKELANNPNLQNDKQGKNYNRYLQILPGISTDFNSSIGKFHASIFHGMIAPSKVFGFLVEQNGIIVNPFAGSTINIEPELSWNKEITWTSTRSDKLKMQIAVFRNDIYNLYAAGRNEVFDQLGTMRVQGIEIGTQSNFVKNIGDSKIKPIKFTWNNTLTLLNSQVNSGILNDKDLFSQIIHSSSTKNEFINLVNNNRDAFKLYRSDLNGELVEITEKVINEIQFADIKKAQMDFSKVNQTFYAPYTPKWSINTSAIFEYRPYVFGITLHYTSAQFTEYFNFKNESADGSVGQLPAYYTADIFGKVTLLDNGDRKLEFTINGKNVTGQLYRSSRLNRATSGIFPAGFPLWMGGLNFTF